MSEIKLVLATHNLHKQKEMNSILSSLEIHIVGLEEFPQIGDIEETGTTLIENAFIKARTVHKLTGLASIADDTGLEVDALNGAPGVYSARYAGKNPTYEENCEKLLYSLRNFRGEKRIAKFRTVVAFVDRGKEHYTEGIVKGLIANEYIGEDGFGYDPIFMPDSLGLTYAQMNPIQKNSMSHRFKALKKMKTFLVQYLKKKEGL